MDGVFLLVVAVLFVLVVLAAGAMWLYPEIDLDVRVAGAKFELHGWRPSLWGRKRRRKCD
jgi:hypothetical protein